MTDTATPMSESPKGGLQGRGAASQGRESGFRQRLAGLVRERWPQIVTFQLALAAIEAIRSFSLAPFTLVELFTLGIGASVLLIVTLIGGCAVGGTLVADALPIRGGAHVVAVVVLAVAGAMVGAGVIVWLAPGLLLPAKVAGEGLTSTAFLLRNLWYYSGTSLLLAAYFATRDRDAATARMAQAAELERSRAQRAVMESRLKVIQARVEPELLFDVLADVQRLYATAPAQAEALLDDLILYLRAALPQMRGTTSTLCREAVLATALLKVTPAARDGTLVQASRIPRALAELPFPPMVLLPLVHAAADARVPCVTLSASARDAVAPACSEVEVKIAVAGTAIAPVWTDERLAAPRAILASYYGNGTALDLRTNASSSAVTLRFTVSQALLCDTPVAVPSPPAPLR